MSYVHPEQNVTMTATTFLFESFLFNLLIPWFYTTLETKFWVWILFVWNLQERAQSLYLDSLSLKTYLFLNVSSPLETYVHCITNVIFLCFLFFSVILPLENVIDVWSSMRSIQMYFSTKKVSLLYLLIYIHIIFLNVNLSST